jgi:hypothetical protein
MRPRRKRRTRNTTAPSQSGDQHGAQRARSHSGSLRPELPTVTTSLPLPRARLALSKKRRLSTCTATAHARVRSNRRGAQPRVGCFRASPALSQLDSDHTHAPTRSGQPRSVLGQPLAAVDAGATLWHDCCRGPAAARAEHLVHGLDVLLLEQAMHLTGGGPAVWLCAASSSQPRRRENGTGQPQHEATRRTCTN